MAYFIDHIKEKMSTFSVQIGEEIIVLRTASDKTRLKLTFNRFIKALEILLLLKENKR